MVTKKKIRTPGAPPPYLGRSPKLIHFFGVASLSREWPKGRIAFPNILCKHIFFYTSSGGSAGKALLWVNSGSRIELAVLLKYVILE